jgi:hypothetical protein
MNINKNYLIIIIYIVQRVPESCSGGLCGDPKVLRKPEKFRRDLKVVRRILERVSDQWGIK